MRLLLNRRPIYALAPAPVRHIHPISDFSDHTLAMNMPTKSEKHTYSQHIYLLSRVWMIAIQCLFKTVSDLMSSEPLDVLANFARVS